MADVNSGATFWALPLSGAVTQDIHPVVSWWRGALSQIGFININGMSSADRDLEMKIVRDVGSYGKQLGRVVEALRAICDHLDPATLGPDERQAIRDFTHLADEIAVVKRAHQPMTKGAVDQFITAVDRLKDEDRATYDQIIQRLRAELLTDGAAADPTAAPRRT